MSVGADGGASSQGANQRGPCLDEIKARFESSAQMPTSAVVPSEINGSSLPAGQSAANRLARQRWGLRHLCRDSKLVFFLFF